MSLHFLHDLLADVALSLGQVAALILGWAIVLFFARFLLFRSGVPVMRSMPGSSPGGGTPPGGGTGTGPTNPGLGETDGGRG